MEAISEKDFFVWISAPLIGGLRGKSRDEVLGWLSENKILPARLAGIAQRAHILSVSVLRACLGDYPIPPGFPSDLSSRFRQSSLRSFMEKYRLDEEMLQKYTTCWKNESQLLQSKGPLINFLTIRPEQVLDILTGEGSFVKEEGLDHYFRRKIIDALGANSALPFLLAEHNILLSGMASLFSDGLERCGVSYICRSLPNELSDIVNKRIWEYRHLLGVSQAEAPTIPKLSRIESKKLRKMLADPESEMEIAALILPESDIMMAVEGAEEKNPQVSPIAPPTLDSDGGDATHRIPKEVMQKIVDSERTSQKLTASALPSPATPTGSEALDVTPISSQLPAAEQDGEYIGKYKILDIIGYGGMGAVYKGVAPETGETVAIKIMRNPEEATDEDMMRFKQEAKLASHLDHPNIVRVYEAEIEGKTPYLVMQYVEGTPLSKLIDKVSFKRALEIVRDALRGLEHAHHQGIIHRDIKPSNIMITDDYTPLLMDFGLAKDIFSKDPHITKMGEVLGTPQYMSPEQARGKVRELDGRTDIYSMGVVFYELITGTSLVKGRTSVDILYHVVNTSPIPPRNIRRRIPPAIESVCLRALEKSKETRYQKAEEMADDIDKYLAGEPTAPFRNISARHRVRHWLRLNKKALLPVSLAAFSIFLCTLAALFWWNKTKWDPQEEKRLERQAVSWLKNGNLTQALASVKGQESLHSIEGYLSLVKASESDDPDKFDKTLHAWEKAPWREHLKALSFAKEGTMRGALLAKLGLPCESWEALDQASEEEKMSPLHYFMKGYALFLMGEEKKSRLEIEKASRRSEAIRRSNHPLALYSFSRFAEAYHRANSLETLSHSLVQAMVLLTIGKHEEGEQALQRVSFEYPFLPGPWLLMARCYSLHDYPQKGREALERLDSLKGTLAFPPFLVCSHIEAGYRFALIDSAGREKMTERVLSWADGLLQREIEKEVRFRVLLLQGECLLLKKESERACKIARELFENRQDDLAVGYLLVKCLLARGAHDDALNVAYNALERDRESGPLRHVISGIYYRLKRYKEAQCNVIRSYWLLQEDPFTQALWKGVFGKIEEMKHSYYLSWENHVESQRARPHFPLKQHYAKANFPDWEYDPDFYDSILKQAEKLGQENKSEQAISLLEEVLDTHDCRLPALRSSLETRLARFYMNRGHTVKALEYYSLAIESFPGCLEAWKDMATHFLEEAEKSGAKDREKCKSATAYVRMVLLLAPSEGREWQERLQKLPASD